VTSVEATRHDHVAAIRHFNRFYTRQIGVLQQTLLDSPFSLTEVRVLYELARRETTTASALRRELGLDAGYLSRMLRGFVKRGFLERRASPDDGRETLLALTGAGETVFRSLDSQSSKQVGEMIGEVAITDRGRLVEAMKRIERLLSPPEEKPAPYMLRPPQAGDLGWIVQRHGALYAQEYHYDERFEALVAEIVAAYVQNQDLRRERCWIAEKDGEPVGAVVLVRKSDRVAKLRLLLVEPSARGLGIGKRLVEECVRFARQVGYKKIVLWTQSELKAARGIYEQAGFRLAAEKAHASWGRENLVAETWELKLKGMDKPARTGPGRRKG
jgi:DNA-binding MarR family transcriptional regulator/N-acetylglutamate synthase-like GNAT family acetyltransferase